MGALCCCLCPEDFEEYAYSSNPIYRHCLCLRYFFHQLLNGYGETFQRLDGRLSAQIQTTSLTSSAPGSVSDSSLSETSHLVPRPPPYEIDPRYSLSQHEGLVLRREKSMSHILEDLRTLRRNGSSSAVETLGSVNKRNITESVEGCKVTHIESEQICLQKHLVQVFLLRLQKMKMSALHVWKNILQKIPKLWQSVLIIFILVVYMNGWKEVTLVQSAERRWNSMRAHDEDTDTAEQ